MRNQTYAGPEPIDPVADWWDTNAATNIRPNSEDAASKRNECAFASCTSTRGEQFVARVQGSSKDIVVTISSHDWLRQIGLGVKNRVRVLSSLMGQRLSALAPV
jgi:hypothetical protein